MILTSRRSRLCFGLATAVVIAGAVATTHAQAGIVDTPECRVRLARVSSLVDAVASRENSVPKGNMPALCKLLRTNLKDMQEARDGMAQCLTGHEKGENVAQMDASILDIRHVLARRCK